jgi:hypothetical protein
VITLDPFVGVAGQHRSPAVVLFPAMVELGVRDVTAERRIVVRSTTLRNWEN